MTKISTKDWRNLPLDKWNTTTVHEYLAHLNEERTGATYVPFGAGGGKPVSERWRIEKGQIKAALTRYGAPVIKRFIDICFATQPHNPKFPVLNFGFMLSFKREELARAEVEERSEVEAEQASESETEDESWRDYI